MFTILPWFMSSSPSIYYVGWRLYTLSPFNDPQWTQSTTALAFQNYTTELQKHVMVDTCFVIWFFFYPNAHLIWLFAYVTFCGIEKMAFEFKTFQRAKVIHLIMRHCWELVRISQATFIPCINSTGKIQKFFHNENIPAWTRKTEGNIFKN